MQKSFLLSIAVFLLISLSLPALVRTQPASASDPSGVAGIWLGKLQAGSATLHIRVTVTSDSAGKLSCALDSLEQGALGLECANVALKSGAFSFDVPAVHGRWEGRISADGKTLTGTWAQGAALELNFVRQSAAPGVLAALAPAFDPALPPVSAADLKSVLDRDLAKTLESGELAPSTGAGISIGVVVHGVRCVFSYGAARPDSIFEIGSMTKTFTGLILAQMAEQGKVEIDDPVRDLLPQGTVAKPDGPEITLLDLATQRSGLPRMPDNFKPADRDNPYADYHAVNLYAYIGKHGVAVPAGAAFLYSNLGFGLLGQALSVRAGVPYPELLRDEVTVPLGLTDTSVALSPAQLKRFLPGHDGDHKPAHAWDLDALAGAGAIRSTAGDMLKYLEANLHPENLKPPAGNPAGATLQAAFNLSHQLRAESLPGMRIALAWLYKSDTGDYWHNGATGGYSAYGFFNPKGDYAAVVLLNTSIGNKGNFVDKLGEHISQRLAGKPAISLAN